MSFYDESAMTIKHFSKLIHRWSECLQASSDPVPAITASFQPWILSTLLWVVWCLAFGFWLLAFGFWLLLFGFGFWLLAFGNDFMTQFVRFQTSIVFLSKIRKFKLDYDSSHIIKPIIHQCSQA